MTAVQFHGVADRISALWPPVMTAVQVEAYFTVLGGLEVDRIEKALALIARQPRSFRPDPGLIYETAMAQQSPALALPAATVDPVDAEEHERVKAENRQHQTSEHRRRVAVVMDILRATGKRIPLTELPALMATRSCSAEEFDRRIARFRGEA